MREKLPNHGQCLARIGKLPTNQHQQGKTEEEEDQPGESILDADHFVVGGENIFSQPNELVMLTCRAGAARRRMVIVMRLDRSGSVHFRRRLPPQYLERSAICKARNLQK